MSKKTISHVLKTIEVAMHNTLFGIRDQPSIEWIEIFVKLNV